MSKQKRRRRRKAKLARSGKPRDSDRPGLSRFEVAHRMHQQGQLDAAKERYVDILTADPDYVDAWHFLGVALYQCGQHPAALECLTRADQLTPDDPEVLSHLGLVYRGLNQGEAARDSLSRAVSINPSSVNALTNLGTVLLELRHYDAAEQKFREALKYAPRHAEALSNLGNLFQLQGRIHEALDCYRRVLDACPDDGAALNNLGSCLMVMHRWQDAISHLRRAIDVCPQFAEARVNLARCFLRGRQPDEAIRCLGELLTLDPRSPQAHNYLGKALAMNGHYEEAAASFEQAIANDATYAHAYSSLAESLVRRGKLQEAIKCHRTVLELRPDWHVSHSHLLFALSSDSTLSSQELLREHRQWGELHGDVPRICAAFDNVRDISRRLRVGYVSPDFREHALVKYIEPILRCHSATEVTTYCYSNVIEEDATTDRLRGYVDHWRSTCEYSDLQVAEMIHGDRIDILVDLAGHTGGNRLRAFAYRPAPVQVTWLGYPNTTGLSAVDYYLTNSVQCPANETCHVERLAYLDIDTCFTPPSDAPDVQPGPARETGRITLGALHRYEKLSPGVFDLWADIMRMMPTAQLLLYNTSFTSDVRDYLRRELVGRSVERDRLEVLGHTDLPSHFHMYHHIDIGLDVFPWNGGTTNREALWMGVPVVGLYGDRSSARSTAAALHQVGLPELVAHAPDEYVEIVQRLGSNLDKLEELRHSMRSRMRNTLCDGPRVTKDLERLYRAMWRAWCESNASSNNACIPERGVSMPLCESAPAAPTEVAQ